MIFLGFFLPFPQSKLTNFLSQHHKPMVSYLRRQVERSGIQGQPDLHKKTWFKKQFPLFFFSNENNDFKWEQCVLPKYILNILIYAWSRGAYGDKTICSRWSLPRCEFQGSNTGHSLDSATRTFLYRMKHLISLKLHFLIFLNSVMQF